MKDGPYDKPSQPKEADAPVLVLALMFAVMFLVIGWMNSPSNRHPDHQNAKPAQYSQEASIGVAKSNHPVSPISKAEKGEQDDHHIKEANLKIQWVMADIAWMGLFIGGIGIIFIVWTLKETQTAGKLVAKQNENARKATVAEFQPYLTFSERIEVGKMQLTYCPEEEHRIVGATAVVTSERVNISPTFYVTNRGKTPARDFDISYFGKITNQRVVTVDKERDTITEVFKFSDRCVGPEYLGVDEKKPFHVLKTLIYDKDITDSPVIENTIEISFLNAIFVFDFIVSFTDEFSDKRRAFIVSYTGRADSKWITSSGIRELVETEQEYKTHDEAYRETLK